MWPLSCSCGVPPSPAPSPSPPLPVPLPSPPAPVPGPGTGDAPADGAVPGPGLGAATTGGGGGGIGTLGATISAGLARRLAGDALPDFLCAARRGSGTALGGGGGGAPLNSLSGSLMDCGTPTARPAIGTQANSACTTAAPAAPAARPRVQRPCPAR